MTAIHHSPNPYLTVFHSDATKLDQARNGVLLASGQTYYVGFGAEGALIQSVHLAWDSAVILTITVWDSNNPDVEVYSSTAGDWVQENPSSGVYVGGDGAGGLTATGLTLVVAGGTAGGAMLNLGNMGGRRQRLRVVVGGTGGRVKIMGHARQ